MIIFSIITTIILLFILLLIVMLIKSICFNQIELYTLNKEILRVLEKELHNETKKN